MDRMNIISEKLQSRWTTYLVPPQTSVLCSCKNTGLEACLPVPVQPQKPYFILGNSSTHTKHFLTVLHKHTRVYPFFRIFLSYFFFFYTFPDDFVERFVKYFKHTSGRASSGGSSFNPVSCFMLKVKLKSPGWLRESKWEFSKEEVIVLFFPPIRWNWMWWFSAILTSLMFPGSISWLALLKLENGVGADSRLNSNLLKIQRC